VNEKFLKKCKPGEKVFFIPDEKELEITCLDDKGRDGNVNVSIKYY
jgi:penicillin-binding protein 1C